MISDTGTVLQLDSPTAHWSYGPLVLRPVSRSHTAGPRGRGIDVGKGRGSGMRWVSDGTGRGRDGDGNNQ